MRLLRRFKFPAMDTAQKQQLLITGAAVLVLAALMGLAVSLFAGGGSDSALPVAWTPRPTQIQVALPTTTTVSVQARVTSTSVAPVPARPSATPSLPPPTSLPPTATATPTVISDAAPDAPRLTPLKPVTRVPTQPPTVTPIATATSTPTEEPPTLEPPTLAPPTPAPPTQVPPTLRPTATRVARAPTPTRASLESPILLWPEPDANLGGLVVFRWEPAGTLPAGAAYEVVGWQPGEAPDAARGLAAPTQAATLTIDLDALARNNLLPSTRFLWTVIVVQTTPYTRLTQPEAGRARMLYYQPPSATPVPPR